LLPLKPDAGAAPWYSHQMIRATNAGKCRENSHGNESAGGRGRLLSDLTG